MAIQEYMTEQKSDFNMVFYLAILIIINCFKT